MEGRRLYVKHPSYNNKFVDESSEMKQSGVLGMKWGIRRYQYEDGTLTPLGKIHYHTSNKYHLMSDDDIRKQLNRKNLENNLELLKKQTSPGYRLKTKLEGAAEDLAVSAARRAAEKVVYDFIDKKVGDFLNKDKAEAKKMREEAEAAAKAFVSTLSDKELAAFNKRSNMERQAIKTKTGFEPTGPLDTKVPETKEDKPKQQQSPSKSETPKAEPEKKAEEPKRKEPEKKSEPEKPLINQKKPVMKEISTKKEEPKINVKRDSEEKKPEAPKISDAKKNAIIARKRSGGTIEEIAKAFSVSPSIVEEILKNKGS